MRNTITRWGMPLTSLLVLGPIALWFTSGLRAPDGDEHTSLLLASSPILGLLAGIASLALAGVAGWGGARLVGLRSGLFCTGLVLAWAAWGTGTMDQIMRQENADSATWKLAVEGLLLGAGALAVGAVVTASARDAQLPAGGLFARSRRIVLDVLGSESRESHPWVPVATLLAALGAGAVVTYILAAEPLKGQSLGATAVGGLVAAGAGMLVALGGEEEGETRSRAPVLTFIIALCLLGAMTPVIASVVHSGGVAEAATTGHLIPLSRPLPLDWIAGAFLGIPIGLSWSEGLIERKTT